MTKALRTKAKKIQKQLEALYPETPIPLDHKDPYTLLVAVLLSAQSKDERVNKITPKLFAMADNPADMCTHTPQEIEEIIRPCGLAPRKSVAIWELSKILIEEFGGQVPDHFEGLEGLPGVGHKTASVVMAQAFGKPAFPVDTHIHRLAKRWGLSSGKNVVRTEEDLKALFAKKSWHKLHLQIIFFGREYCPARGHKPEECPICSWAYIEGSDDKPKKAAKPKKASKTTEAASTPKKASKKAPSKTTTKTSKAPSKTKASKAPSKTTASKVSKAPSKTTASKAPSKTKTSKAPSKTTASKVSKASSKTKASKASKATSKTTKASKAPSKTTASKASKATSKTTKAPSKTTASKATSKTSKAPKASSKSEEGVVKKPLSVAVAVVRWGQKILLIRRERGDYVGLWGLPGGKIEGDEHLWEAVVRELEEEAGLRTEFQEHLGVVSEHLFEGQERKQHFLLHICALKPLTRKLRATDEGELRWFGLEELSQEALIPSDFAIIEQMVQRREHIYFDCALRNTAEGVELLYFAPQGQAQRKPKSRARK